MVFVNGFSDDGFGFRLIDWKCGEYLVIYYLQKSENEHNYKYSSDFLPSVPFGTPFKSYHRKSSSFNLKHVTFRPFAFCHHRRLAQCCKLQKNYLWLEGNFFRS